MDTKKAPKEEFLANPETLHYFVCCVTCKHPIWESKVLKMVGNQVSWQHLKCDPSFPEPNQKITVCPICKKNFFMRGKKGGTLHMLKDAHTGIMRLT